MALQKQTLHLDFTKGVDTGRDPKSVIPSKLSRLENMEWGIPGELVQRPGFTAATITEHTGSPAVSNIRRLSTFGEEVLLESDTGLHAFAQNRVISRDPPIAGGALLKTFERAEVRYRDVASSQQDQFGFDAAVASPSGLECWVWTEDMVENSTKRAVFYRVVDSASRATVQEGVVSVDSTLVGKAFNPRVVVQNSTALSSKFFIYYAQLDVATGTVTNVAMRSLTIATGSKVPGALSATILVGNAIQADGIFDVVIDGMSIALAVKGASGGIIIHGLSSADGNTIQYTSGAEAGTPVNAISLAVIYNGGIGYAVACCHRGSAAPYSIWAFSFPFMIGGSVTSGVLATGDVLGRVAAIPSPFDSARVLVFYDVNPYTAPGSAFSNDVNLAGCDYAGLNPLTASTFARSVVLAARPYAYYSTLGLVDVCVPVALLSSLQPTIFALKFGGVANASGFGIILRYSSPRVLARILPGECGNLKGKYNSGLRMPTCLARTTVTVSLPITRLGKTRLENGLNITPSRLALATITFSLAMPSVQAADTLLLTGGCPMLYDGALAHEAGYHYYPEDVIATSVGSGSLTPNKTYGYVVVYEWEDSRGELHRSAPSVPVSVAMGANTSVTLRIPYLRLTDKQGAEENDVSRRENVRVVSYRTEGDGTIYYREAAIGITHLNRLSLLVPCIRVSSQSDASLIQGELLYTTGGGLENEAFPSHSVAVTHQRRLFMAPRQANGFVQYTDVTDDLFLAFATNEIYRIPIPPAGGVVLGLASMDEKLIILCEKQIYYIYGEGPNRLGQQDGYSLPIACSTAIGMLDGTQESLALTPDGLWFMSSTNGLRLLTRGLTIAVEPGGEQDAYLGREADGFFTAAYGGIQAQIISGKNQVRWYLAGANKAVVWDYQRHQWSLFTNQVCVGGSTVARGKFWHASNAELFSSDAVAGSTDKISAVDAVLETAWISLADRQGFQRAYALLLLGKGIAAGNVKVEVGYNYVETYAASQSFEIATGGAAVPLQLEHALTIQKCESVRFRITLTPNTTSEWVRLTSFAVTVGLKPGTFRLPAASRF